jgi:hypothetical protein
MAKGAHAPSPQIAHAAIALEDVVPRPARKGRGRPGEIDVTPPARIGEAKAAAEAPQAVDNVDVGI